MKKNTIKFDICLFMLLLSGCGHIGIHGSFSTGYFRGYYDIHPHWPYYGGKIIISRPPVYIGRPLRRPRHFRPFRPFPHYKPQLH